MEGMKLNYIRLNSIKNTPSLCDGIGYRTVVFLQGCNIRCPGCHNQSTRDINGGNLIEIDKLVEKLRTISFNKKVTISGGEPLIQKEALLCLLEKIKDFDICLYTSYELKDVPDEILSYIKYIKVGKYIKELHTSVKPFVGSTNQEFLEVKHE